MSWSRRAALLSIVALAGCGFQPVYGPGGTGSALQGRVEVQEPTTQNGYLMTRQLETRLGRANAPAYLLEVKLATGEEGLAINREGDTTRYNVLGAAEYNLRSAATGAVVTSGRVENFTGYSATGSTVATLAAERDATERLMVILADEIVTRLLATKL